MEEQVKLLTEARDSAVEAMKSRMADASSESGGQVATLAEENSTLKDQLKVSSVRNNIMS